MEASLPLADTKRKMKLEEKFLLTITPFFIAFVWTMLKAMAYPMPNVQKWADSLPEGIELCFQQLIGNPYTAGAATFFGICILLITGMTLAKNNEKEIQKIGKKMNWIGRGIDCVCIGAGITMAGILTALCFL